MQLCQQHKVGKESPNVVLLVLSLKDVLGVVRIEEIEGEYDTFFLYPEQLGLIFEYEGLDLSDDVFPRTRDEIGLCRE